MLSAFYFTFVSVHALCVTSFLRLLCQGYEFSALLFDLEGSRWTYNKIHPQYPYIVYVYTVTISKISCANDVLY